MQRISLLWGRRREKAGPFGASAKLLRLSRDISTTLDFETVIGRSLDAIRELSNCGCAAVDIAGKQHLSLTCSNDPLVRPFFSRMSGILIQEAAPVYISDLSSEPERLSGSYFGAPLITDGKVAGAVHSYSTQRDAFDLEIQSTVFSFLPSISGALQNANMFSRELEAVRRLREADELKHEFLSVVSHELRTPLTSISGFIQTLLHRWETIEDDKKLEFLSIVDRNANELDTLIARLLDAARLKGNPGLNPTRLNLRNEVDQSLEYHREILRELNLAVDLPDEEPVVSDPVALQTVLACVITNAAKFSPEMGTIRLASHRENGSVVVSVADSGPGVPPEDRDKIFEAFYQAERPVAKAGAGIGLSTARQYLRLQGGDIWLQSSDASGSTFCFSLRAA